MRCASGGCFGCRRLALRDATVDAYWLVYPPALHDWRPLALLRRWLHAQIEASARAWSASDASPLASVGAAALAGGAQPAGRKSCCRSDRKSKPRALGRTRETSRSMSPRRSACRSAGSTLDSGSPVRSLNRLLGKTLAQAQRVEHELEGQRVARDLVLVAHGLPASACVM